MSLSTPSALHRQVTAVRRRLFLQTLIRALAWSWFAAMAVAVVWFLIEPLLFSAPPAWLRWTVLGVAVAAGTAAGVAFAVMRKASPVQAALALDEQFRLKERVTTSLLLGLDEAASPAGAALLADADQRVRPLRVGERFPVRVPWTASLAPAAAVLLLLLIYFYHPDFSKAQAAAPTQKERNAAMLAAIDPVQQQLQKQSEARKNDPPKSERLKEIEAEIDKMVNNRHDTPEEVRDDIQKGDDVLNDLKKQDQAAAEAARALKERLEELERARKKDEQAKRDDGPAKDLNQALDQGDLAQAQREADRLADKLDANQKADELKQKIAAEKDPEKKQELQDELKKKEDEGLKKDDRDKLADQLKDLKDDADQLTRKNEDDQKKKDDDEKKLDDQAKKDGADKDQLQKEKDQLEKDKAELKQQQQDLKGLAQKLDQAQKAMQQGKDGQAAQQLKDAGDQMGQMSKQDERDRIARDAQQVQDMKQALAQGLAKQDAKDGKPGAQAAQGDQQGKPGDQAAQGPNPQGKPGTGAGNRPEGADAPTGERNQQIHSDPNDKAPLQVVGDADGPHDRFKGPTKPGDMQADIHRAAQEGEAAAENEKVTDKGSAETAGEWFKAIGEKPGDKKPAPPK